ncbi:MAG: helix-turn-helix transcriptional regulator [Actinobacteria bacterium]|nr:helix-turn-helix transcriptional regulator [Actinomycetota bacterium]MBI3686231.1 helix-turn-helix transcriptional regulator [Actinomycetota bacterium]
MPVEGTDGTSADDRDDWVGEVERLDIGALGQMLRERRAGLSIRQAARDAGVSFSTFARVEGGAQPDLATFARLCAWLGVSPARFFTPVVERETSPLEDAITHLTGDPRLSAVTAGRIAGVLRDMYEALARDAAPQPIIACHLRAAPLLRPGVAPRLAALLTDLHDELQRQVEAR